jgi:nucleoredoxin
VLRLRGGAKVLALLGDTLRKPDGSTAPVSELVGDKDVLALYFSAHWCPPCRGFTPTLCEKYTALKKAGKSMELVFVSSDRDEAAYTEYANSMTFPSLPFALRDAKAKLSKMFKVSGIPSLVFYDLKTDKLITDDGRSEVMDSSYIENFPYTPPTFSLALLGDKLLKPDGSSVAASTALDVDVLALYFSAHWCPPCRGFTPTLSTKYTALKDAGKSLEMVFVSSDRDEAAFKEYHSTMSFMALPFELRDAKGKLSKIFKVNGIPSLCFINARTGELITSEGRGGVSSDTFVEDFPYHPKPVNDLSASTEGINDNACLIVLMEGSDKVTQTAMTDTLTAIAEAELRKPETEQTVARFFTGKGGGPVDRIRSMFGLGEKADKPLMLLIDLEDDGAYYPAPEGEVNADSIKAYIKGLKDGSLAKKNLS